MSDNNKSYTKIRYGLEWLSKNIMDATTRKKFYTKSGELSQYALACGYIQVLESIDEKVRVKLFADNSHYHVRVFSDRYIDAYKTLPWDVFEYNRLTDARKAFYKHANDYCNMYRIK